MKRIRNKLQTTTEREADFLSEITDRQDRKFILHVEFQTQDDVQMLYRLQEYHGIISRKYRLPVRHYVFYFGDGPSKMLTKLPPDSQFDGFTLLDFQTIHYRDLLLSKTGSEIVLAILADFKDKPAEAIIRLILSRLKEVSQSKAELKKYFNQLNVLSKLRNLSKETIKNISSMPITIDIEKDYLYQKGLEKGLEEGFEKGARKGETLGNAKGEAKKTYIATVNMLKKGFDAETICEVLEVTEDYDFEVKKKLEPYQ